MKKLSLVIFSFFVLLATPSAFAAFGTSRPVEGGNVTAENCDDEKCAANVNNNPCNTAHRNCPKEAEARYLEVFGNDGKGKSNKQDGVE